MVWLNAIPGDIRDASEWQRGSSPSSLPGRVRVPKKGRPKAGLRNWPAVIPFRRASATENPRGIVEGIGLRNVTLRASTLCRHK